MLWHKPVSQIDFSDVDAFCKAMMPEGARLDYKGVSFPKDLAKSIAAFANTLGGLIILGVEADKTSNKPVWPPTHGLPKEDGLVERVIQIAQDAIYPPVTVAVSNPIHNAALPGHVILVIRINESREAPHAIDRNRKVYVYARTENKNEPCELADIDRIQHLLSRRQRLIDRRESELGENLARGQRIMHRSICPIRWVSIAPIYPWRSVHDQCDCKGFHQGHLLLLFNGSPTFQSIVGGSLCVVRHQQKSGPWIPVACSSIAANGTLFGMGYTHETMYDNPTIFTGDEQRGKMWVDMTRYREIIPDFLETARQFYSLSKNPPGEIMLSVGMKNALGVSMHDSFSRQKTNTQFPDPEYRVDLILQREALGIRIPEIEDLFHDIIFAFNANALQS